MGPLFAGLYKGAATLLDSCEEQWALCYICHCAREILNRIPEMEVGDLDRNQSEEGEALDRLVELWDRNGLRFDGDAESRELTPIPSEIFAALADFIENRKAGTLSNDMKSEILAARHDGDMMPDPSGALSPRAKEIKKARKWFQRYAHATSRPRQIPPQAKTLQHFELLEAILDERMDAYWARRDRLRAVLDAANEREVLEDEQSAGGVDDER
jgi:hypothetical protein